MTCVVLYAGRPDQREVYQAGLSAGLRAEGVEARLVMDPGEVAPEAVDYLVFAASGPVRDFAPFTRLRAILNLWAGVEAVLALDPPPAVPLLRMIEPGLRLGMVDYCMGHVLRHHLGADRFVGVRDPVPWEAGYPPLAQDRAVGVLGLGALGRPVAEAPRRQRLPHPRLGARAKEIAGVACHSGEAGLDVVLARSEILCLLLPHTPGDRADPRRAGAGADAARRLPRQCRARAADRSRGTARRARPGPYRATPPWMSSMRSRFPSGHPYWRHPRVTVTPHIASVTRPETASRAAAANIARNLRGEGLEGVVDRESGY